MYNCIADGNLEYVPVTQELEVAFGIQLKEKEETPKNNKTMWSKDATLQLISMIKKYQNDFKSTSVKNDVYKKNSDAFYELGLKFTVVQIKDKNKYHKMRYMKRRDNMKTSGEEKLILNISMRWMKYMAKSLMLHQKQ